MRKLTIILLTMLSLGAMAQRNDTVVICNANKVDIKDVKDVKGDKYLQVNVYGKGLNENFHYQYNAMQTDEKPDADDWDVDFIKNKSKKIFGRKCDFYNIKKKRWTYFDGIHINYVLPDKDNGLRNGWELGFENLVCFNYAPWKKGPQFKTGFGLAAGLYRMNKDIVFGKERKRLVSSAVTEDIIDNNPSITTTSIQLPLDVYQPLTRNLAVGVGAVLDWNVSLMARNKYKIGDIQYDETIRGLNYRPLGVELKAFVRYGDVTLNVKYTPTKIFKAGDGPQFNRLTIGLTANL